MHKEIYYIYIIPLLISAISSLRAFRQKWPLSYRWFSIFLFTTLFVEVFAILWKDYLYLHKTPYWNYSKQNVWLYNIFFLPQYIFYVLFYYSVLKLKLVRKAIRIILPLFIIFGIYNITMLQGLYVTDNYTLVVCCLLVIWLSGSYFYQLLKQKRLVVLQHEPLVWISSGAFLFHMGCLPFFVWFNTLVMASISKAFSFLGIAVVLNSVMYSSYSIAFLWNKKFPD